MQDNKFSLSRIVLLFLQGALIGTGAILPGISGGVLCVAFGLYEPMVGLFVHPWQSLHRNYRLFIPLILGGGLGFLLLARAGGISAHCGGGVHHHPVRRAHLRHHPRPDEKVRAQRARQGLGQLCDQPGAVLFSVPSAGLHHRGQHPAQLGLVPVLRGGVGLQHDPAGAELLLLAALHGALPAMAEGIGHLDFQVVIPLAIGFWSPSCCAPGRWTG